MDDGMVHLKRARIDAALATADPDVGIAFGVELFSAFKSKGWLTLETFGVLGTKLFATKVPAYQKTHYAYCTWDIDPEDFKVGT